MMRDFLGAKFACFPPRIYVSLHPIFQGFFIHSASSSFSSQLASSLLWINSVLCFTVQGVHSAGMSNLFWPKIYISRSQFPEIYQSHHSKRPISFDGDQVEERQFCLTNKSDESIKNIIPPVCPFQGKIVSNSFLELMSSKLSRWKHAIEPHTPYQSTRQIGIEIEIELKSAHTHQCPSSVVPPHP